MADHPQESGLEATFSLGASDASRGTNQSGVRLYNERLVLSLVRRHGPLPKADIARMTGLSAMTTTTIMNRLESEGMLVRQEKQRGRVGQPSVPHALNPDGAFSLGLKIGRRSAELVLVDFVGKVRARLREIYRYPDPPALTAWIETALGRATGELTPAQRRRILGIGVAAPFELWNWEAEVGAPRAVLDAWRSFDVKAQVARISGLDVQVCNDATAACGAELMVGRGGRYRDFAYVFFGSFVGGGVVLNGQLYPGGSGNAGALGSMPVARLDPRGALVRPQLLRQASIYLLEKRLLAAGIDPSPIWTRPSEWAEFGPHLDAWIDEAAKALAPAVIACTAVIDFQAVIIDGAFPDAVRRRLVAAVATEAETLDREGLTPAAIVEGAVGPDARALGAAMLPLLSGFAPHRDVLLKETRA
ncbi:sugar kinase [Alsobacter metallidurans]|uniref:Sugar kinase n=1 Tax=Alsobacter metallidurans TaxID=340221 RepID=A0A917I5U2_9HYPH|nr:ROK family transcriptional regulator [Alsobacter metallidurans]GGH12776.1 sugar kinase [Alsobacter metallidurans]